MITRVLTSEDINAAHLGSKWDQIHDISNKRSPLVDLIGRKTRFKPRSEIGGHAIPQSEGIIGFNWEVIVGIRINNVSSELLPDYIQVQRRQ
jgi:hypothetical protein